jgi:hypothetical protein
LDGFAQHIVDPPFKRGDAFWADWLAWRPVITPRRYRARQVETISKHMVIESVTRGRTWSWGR